jgi:hypothetical protein
MTRWLYLGISTVCLSVLITSNESLVFMKLAYCRTDYAWYNGMNAIKRNYIRIHKGLQKKSELQQIGT